MSSREKPDHQVRLAGTHIPLTLVLGVAVLCAAVAASAAPAASPWSYLIAPNGCKIYTRPIMDGNGRAVGLIAVTSNPYCPVSVAFR